MCGFDAVGRQPIGITTNPSFNGGYLLVAVPAAFVVAGKTANQFVSRFATRVAYTLTGYTTTGKAGIGFFAQTLPFSLSGHTVGLIGSSLSSLFIRNADYVLQQVRKRAPTLDD